mgnify:CR=1
MNPHFFPENILAEQNLEQRSLRENVDKQHCGRNQTAQAKMDRTRFQDEPEPYPEDSTALDTTQKEKARKARNHLAQDDIESE